LTCCDKHRWKDIRCPFCNIIRGGHATRRYSRNTINKKFEMDFHLVGVMHKRLSPEQIRRKKSFMAYQNISEANHSVLCSNPTAQADRITPKRRQLFPINSSETKSVLEDKKGFLRLRATGSMISVRRGRITRSKR